MRKHTGETPYDCPIDTCNEKFKWRSSMAHHVRSHHKPSDFSKSNLPVPDLQNAKPAALVSMSSKKKHVDGVQSGRILKPAAQRSTKINIIKKPLIDNTSQPTESLAENVPEQQRVLSEMVTVESDESGVQQAQNLSQVQTTMPCPNLVLENELQSSVPRELPENIQSDLLLGETQGLAFSNEGISLKTPDCRIDADLLALTEADGLLEDSTDDCDFYFAPSPDNATDADMRFLANNPRYLEPPALSVDQNNWQDHVIYDF